MAIGIIFAILTGLSWVVVGAFVGLAEKRGCGSSRFMLVRSSFSLTVASLLYLTGHALMPGSAFFRFTAEPRAAACMFACGFFNYCMILAMGAAMARGPNGPAWTITQSGFVFPFALGVLSGNTRFTWLLAAGLVLVLSNVVANGLLRGGGSSASADGRGGRRAGWFPLALLAFVFCGINQCASNLVSYLPEDVRPEALERIVWVAVGSIGGWSLDNIWRLLRDGPSPCEAGLRAKYLYVAKICAVNTTISFSASLFFCYEAQDRLKDASAAAIAYPVMVVSCFLGFAAYSVIFLREHLSRLLWLAFAAGVLGIVLLSAGAKG